MSKVVLPAFTGNIAVIDGVLRTVMITGQTIGTRTIVMPLRQPVNKGDIAYRTRLLTTATVNAAVSVNGELPVTYHLRVEVSAKDMREGPWSESAADMTLVTGMFDDEFRILLQVRCRLFYFFTLAGWRICIHKW